MVVKSAVLCRSTVRLFVSHADLRDNALRQGHTPERIPERDEGRAALPCYHIWLGSRLDAVKIPARLRVVGGAACAVETEHSTNRASHTTG